MIIFHQLQFYAIVGHILRKGFDADTNKRFVFIQNLHTRYHSYDIFSIEYEDMSVLAHIVV